MPLSPDLSIGTRHPIPTFAGLSPIAPAAPIIFIAVSDTFTRQALIAAVHDMGWHAKDLSSARALLTEPVATVPNCLVLDVSLPTYGELYFQKCLAAERPGTPVVCITGVADVPMTVRAMKAGAVDVLPKPVRSDLLVDAIQDALTQSESRLRESMAYRSIHESYATLSPRERQVMALVASGLLNKQVGGKLGISEITVKAHRGQVMRKMNTRSFVDLVKMAEKLQSAAN
ncbi:response regulator transcription factor [Starkeya sp. ORNL1]|uniref:response regulator transcription factor n=1 Tax=Starkeya sp. ORNL1 TaxID=2709380 RepID=UPI001464306D|nr:LuxR C-terminal-related transcriptional regulator [Starkeya sp. ORNL1]QJP16763.1 response regulator transcription factor [Starkeya sp. ORNL1]